MRLAGAGLLPVIVAVEIIVRALLTAAALGWLLLIRLALPELLLRRRDQAEIMLGVLIIVFRRDRVARRRRVACKLNVFLGNMIGGAADFDVGTVRFVDAR